VFGVEKKMKKFIPVNEPLLDGNEKKYLAECIDSGWISSEGPFVGRFEEAFAANVGRKHAIAVCNGTAAIDAAVEALEIGVGDEVIMPSFTIISCIAQIVRNGAIPVLVDSDPVTWNMDVDQIEGKITSKTKAIMIVHIFGLPVDVAPILDIASKYGLKVIEDAAEMHGQTYKGKACGGFGDISTFSFYPNKHVTTGEGGMILTDNDELAETCRALRNLCFKPDERFVHERLGWNLRMTNMQAALGLAQLEQLDRFVQRKRMMGLRYFEQLKDLSSIQLPLPETDYAKNIYWVFAIVLKDSVKITVSELISHLAKLGVGARPFFCPMHLQPVFIRKGMFANEFLPVSEKMYRRGFYLPSGLALGERQIDEVARVFRKLLRESST